MRRQQALRIRTPEGIVFPLVIAGPVVRFLALSVDIVCVYVLSGLLTVVAAVIGFVSADLATAAAMILSFLLSLGYPMFFEWSMRGQTPGKRLLRLRVMDVQGLRLTFSQVVVRNLLRFIDSIPAFYLVGGVTALLTSRGQRVGDLAANTLVIHEPRVAEPDLAQILPGKFNSFRAYPGVAARLRQNVGPREAGICLRALLRRDRLDAPHRTVLFGEIRRRLETRARFPPEAVEGISDEQYVRNVTDILFR